MKSMLLSGFAALALLVSTACSSDDNKQENEMKKVKVLIAFFSHAGENYSVGHVDVGNTKIVADYIKERTGADVFEIVAEKSYDMPYAELTKLAQQETESGELPAFKGAVSDLSQYDTVFVGGPIWWGTYPRVMFTFFNQYDLNGKIIIPFVTHEGSGLASTVTDLRRIYPRANVTGAFSIYGHEVRNDKDKVERWLKGLGY